MLKKEMFSAMDERIDNLANEISGIMRELIGVRVYTMFSDANGNLIFSDSIFETHKELIRTFIKSNFNYLKVGEHSIPLSSENIVFFRTSDSSVTVLHNPKGRIGQLLRFKSIMNKYCDRLEQFFVNFIPMESQPVESVPVIVEIPIQEIKLPILSKKESTYSQIRLDHGKKFSGKEKFTFEEAGILRYSEGDHTLLDLFKANTDTEIQLFEMLLKLNTKKIIKFKGHELLKIKCPECKNSGYQFIPNYLLDKNKERIRVQLAPEGCDHTFVAFIDKKLRVKTKKLVPLLYPRDKLELLKLSIENLIAFFGQDLFLNIFHAITFLVPIVFVGDSIEEHIRKLTEFLKRFFPNLAYGVHLLCINQAEYEKNYKNYTHCLVIDFNSHISIDPYEEKEYFDFEYKLFKEVLKIERTNVQVLKVNSEFEALILHTDKILNEIAPMEEISEDDLIQRMKENYDLTIKHEEIPIIQQLAEIYYDTDISKKVIRTVSGQLGSFFDSIRAAQ
jgi:predicted Zn-ribbon and HTH transcriptional regulator